MSASEIKPYGAWESDLTIENFINYSPVGFGGLRSTGVTLFWIESRVSEGGRSVLVRQTEAGQEDVTPSDFSLRTRVHEYGGNPYCIADDWVVFVNDSDQNLYAQSLKNISKVRQLTESDFSERFADPIHRPQANSVICIRERHQNTSEPINDVVSVCLDDGSIETLHEGHDFYAHARPTPDGSKLAFLAWDHPNMPWNGTQLYVMQLAGETHETSIVAGGTAESVCQPEWMSDDFLVFSSDQSGFYDLYGFDPEGVSVVAADEREYGHAMWQLGAKNFTPLSDHIVVAAPNSAELEVVDTFNNLKTPLESSAASYSSLEKHGAGIAYIEGYEDQPSRIRVKSPLTSTARTIKAGDEFPLAHECISRAVALEFPGSKSESVHAYFYPPLNPRFEGPVFERPPLLVLAHGGPTSSTSRTLNLKVQFYTSRGWAVLDVNYSGSTGYGRAYRDRLLDNWGVRDVEDLTAGVRHLASLDKVDLQRVAIAGGSAGGYTVLRALTTSNTFKVGASRYGIADLRALASDTHKFESRYVDQLIPASQLDERSPIHHVEKLNCPVIFSQGLEDKVVPPEQTIKMFEALRAKGIPTAMFLFEGEQHGFRKLDNLVKVMRADYYFFSRVFQFDAPGLDERALEGAQLANMDKL